MVKRAKAKRPASKSRRIAAKGAKRTGGKAARKAASVSGMLQIPKPQKISLPPLVAPVIVAAGSAASLAVRAGAVPKVQTVIYVHGIGNKPVASVLKCQWDEALFGTGLGDRSRMAYWVNREYYPQPETTTCADSDTVEVDTAEVTTHTVLALAKGLSPEELDPVEREIKALARSPEQEKWLRRVAAKLTRTAEVSGERAALDVTAKILPLPGFARERIARGLTRALLRDVNDFMFNAERRKAMTDSLVERLSAGGGPFVVVAHSQGTMISYEVLRQLKKSECDVQLLVTVGSPLGLQEVQDVFRAWTGTPANGKLPRPPCVTRWVNVAERLDPVAVDSDLSDEFQGVENKRKFFLNPDLPWHPHSATGYLRTRWVQDPVRETVSNAFAQATGQMVITRDLAEELENARAEDVRRALIELRSSDSQGSVSIGDLAVIGKNVADTIRKMETARTRPPEQSSVEVMRRFVSAELTRNEAEQLRTLFNNLNIQRIWRDMEKRALINVSTHTIQARPANLGYGATGAGIGWAVLDTGIRGDHPHFQLHKNIVMQFDCTKTGAPVQHFPDSAESRTLDANGHGTHVAGTIAGEFSVKNRSAVEVHMAGMAPQTKLFGFKVLRNDGTGSDSFIIKALDKIAEINESSSQLVIHGVNLSLGGGFDPSVYGCGHTPLCQELRRLWRQGVLVCLAAGNEGYAMLRSDAGLVAANLDLSIGDPANLEEAIAVGSVHKSNPHTYGISYFSSRGPTADGRRKPDVVAPGEGILSAFHDWPATKAAAKLTFEDLYVEMSGTSMAAPHVSGVLSAFLSIRREFVSFPDRVKDMLLRGCTSLARDPYIQGGGMPNLIKMLSDS